MSARKVGFLMDNIVTGCIVTYNNISTINDTLKSLFEFTADIDFKLYIVDNGSSDGTVEFIKKNYPQAEIIVAEKNLGFGAGHNKVISMINSKYHVVINPDIVFVENTVKKMTDYLEKHDEIGLLSPKICFPNGNSQILGKRNPKLKYLVASRLRGDSPGKLLREYAMLDENLDEPVEIENATGCFMIFRTSVLKKINGFDERYFMYFEDSDITREINKISKAVYYPDAVINHVWGRESKRNLKLMLIHIQSMLKYFVKWKTI